MFAGDLLTLLFGLCLQPRCVHVYIPRLDARCRAPDFGCLSSPSVVFSRWWFLRGTSSSSQSIVVISAALGGWVGVRVGALQILVANNGIGAVKAIRSMRKWVRPRKEEEEQEGGE